MQPTWCTLCSFLPFQRLDVHIVGLQFKSTENIKEGQKQQKSKGWNKLSANYRATSYHSILTKFVNFFRSKLICKWLQAPYGQEE